MGNTIAAIALIAFVGYGSASGSGEAVPSKEKPAPTCRAHATESFEFYVDPWINLHHLLFEWARSEEKPLPGDRRPILTIPEKAKELPPAESAAWSTALSFYRANLVAKNMTFDAGLTESKRFLIGLRCQAPDSASAPAEMGPWILALKAAMPVYEAHFWPEHRVVNAALADRLAASAAQLEAYFAQKLPATLGGTWPPSKVRVDLSIYAGTFGGYTTIQPDHIMMGSTDEVKQGIGAVDTLFHEITHSASIEDALIADLERIFAKSGKKVPPELRHVMQFYTSSWLLQQTLGKDAANYRPLAEKNGLYDRILVWRNHREQLDRLWAPFLRGEINREQAITNLAADTPGEGAKAANP